MTATDPPRRKPKRDTSKPTSSKPARKRPLLKYGLISLSVLVSIGAATGYYYYNQLYADMPSLPDTAELWTVKRAPAIEFRSLDGTVLAIRGPRYGQVTRLNTLPPHVPQAFIAAEDKRFYSHDGADTQAIIRAAWVNWRSGRTVSGASTITQQLIKNLVLDPRQTIKRKAQEVRLARELETRLSKDEILELYLNRTYFGAGFYGLDAASRHYFGKPPNALSVGEAALLAALPQAPSRLALDDNLEEARSRQTYVLNQMVDAGFLTEFDAELAAKTPIELVEHTPEGAQFGYVLDAAADQVGEILDDAPPDLVVTLTIEPELQGTVQALIADTMAEKGPDQDATQAAAIVIRRDGRIAALVGGVDYGESQFNRATQAMRQPGSAFKAVVYTAALRNGTDPYDVRLDEPLRIGRWQPRNYAGGYVGPVTLSEAYAESLNTVAARLTQEVGEDRVIETARRLGISTALEPLPSIALGTQETNLLEITRAYGTFMRDGQRLTPYLIARVHDTRGNLLFEQPPQANLPALSSDVSRSMTSMMLRTVAEGTGMSARVDGWQIAGKTGTSQDWRDAWFIGYANPAVTGVWVGNDDDSAMDRVTGGGLPAELFSGIMSAVLADEPVTTLPGTNRYVSLSDDAESRVTFYRGLAGAFATVSGRETATMERASLNPP